MKVIAVVLALAAAASAFPHHLGPAPGYLVPAPQFDSAVIRSDRLGGNFAYSTLEAKAYAAVSPVVHNVISPVGISYHATPVQAFYPAYSPAFVAGVPAYATPVEAYPVPIAPVAAPIAPADTIAPAADPIIAPAAPLADAVEASASSDDSVTIEAA